MNENEFELGGKRYRAVEKEYSTCDGCAFRYLACSHVPPCCAGKRSDKRNVIFVEVKT